ncbi:MAG: nucleotidyltransferase domain-containing protein [Actinomycetota bacterium]
MPLRPPAHDPRGVGLSAARFYEGVRLTLRRLAQSGFLGGEERTAGACYSLNRAHVAHPAAEMLFDMPARLVSRVADTIGRLTCRPLHVSCFGSMARRDGGAESDLDMLVVFDERTYGEEGLWADPVAGLGGAIRRWIGNRAAIMTIGRGDVGGMAAGRRARPLWKAHRVDAVTLYGQDLTRPVR